MEAGDPKTPTVSQPEVRPETPEEQIEGLRAWIASDRHAGSGSAASPAGSRSCSPSPPGFVGVVLATDAKDNSATKSEVASLRDQVSASTKEASQATEDTITGLNDRIDALEARVSTIASSQRTSDSELDVAKDDIEELRGQITDLQNEVNSIDTSSQNLGNGGN